MNTIKLVALVALVSVMLDAGLHANRKSLVNALKDVRLLGRACLANFIIVPLAAVLIVHGLKLDTFIGVGILWMAIAPGVPFVARTAGKMAGGREDLAVDLTFLLPIISVVTIPLTAPLVLPQIGEAHANMGQYMTKLVLFQLLPLVVGLIIADRAPHFAKVLERPLALLFAASVVVLVILLIPDLSRAVMAIQGSRGILAILLIVIVSLVAGWLVAEDPIEHRHTISIATALRNVGLCLSIAAGYDRHTVAASVMTYFLVQFLLVFAMTTRYRRSTRRAHAPA